MNNPKDYEKNDQLYYKVETNTQKDIPVLGWMKILEGPRKFQQEMHLKTRAALSAEQPLGTLYCSNYLEGSGQ